MLPSRKSCRSKKKKVKKIKASSRLGCVNTGPIKECVHSMIFANLHMVMPSWDKQETHCQRTLEKRLVQFIPITKQWFAGTGLRVGSVNSEISARFIMMLKIGDNSLILFQIYQTEQLCHQCHRNWKFIKKIKRMDTVIHKIHSKISINLHQFSILKRWQCTHQWLSFN